MSKVDALRALREARYEAARKGQPRVRGPVPEVPATKGLKKAAKAPAVDELCGHTAISGKSCIRPAGHAEKTHRYPKS